MHHQLADQLQAAYDSLWRTIDLLDAGEVEMGRLENNWTPKALLAHVAFWDEYQRQRMEAALRGDSAHNGFTRPLEDNDARALLDDDRTWNEVVAAADAARQRLIEFTRALDPAVLKQDYREGERMLSLQKLLEQMVRHTQLHAQELYLYAGSMQRWSRTDLRAFLVRQHTNLMDSISGLTEATMLATPVCGFWSIRDVLTHVLSWNEYEYAVLEGWPAAESEKLKPWQAEDDVEALNAGLMAARAHLNMIDICDGLMTYHRRILRAFDRANEEQLRSVGAYDRCTPAGEGAFGGWGEQGSLSGLFYSFALHEAEHAADLWRFRAGQQGRN